MKKKHQVKAKPFHFVVGIVGKDFEVNRRLRDMHELGRYLEPWESVERFGSLRHLPSIDNEVYNADGDPIGDIEEQWNDDLGHAVFRMQHVIVLFIYAVSDGASLRYLEDAYDKLPKPEAHLQFPIAPNKVPNGYILPNSRVRGIILDWGSMTRDHYLTYVPLDRYPVVIAGYKGADSPVREVNEKDIENFLSNHPNCDFGGEFALDNLEEIDAVFNIVVEVVHVLRKLAIQDMPMQDESTRMKKFFQKVVKKLAVFKKMFTK